MDPFHFFQEAAQSLPAILSKQFAKFNLGDKTHFLKNFKKFEKSRKLDVWYILKFLNNLP